MEWLTSTQRIPKPLNAGVWGSRSPGPKYLQPDELLPLAAQLRYWLREDLRIQFDRHNNGLESVAVLRAASYLDPRFKKLDVLEECDRPRVRRWVQAAALRQAQKDPAYLAGCEKLKLEEAAAMAEGEAREAELRADPDNQTLVALANIPSHLGNHMKVDELRAACAKRGLENSGLKAVLVSRLDAYSADAAIASAHREAELNKKSHARGRG